MARIDLGEHYVRCISTVHGIQAPSTRSKYNLMLGFFPTIVQAMVDLWRHHAAPSRVDAIMSDALYRYRLRETSFFRHRLFVHMPDRTAILWKIHDFPFCDRIT